MASNPNVTVWAEPNTSDETPDVWGIDLAGGQSLLTYDQVVDARNSNARYGLLVGSVMGLIGIGLMIHFVRMDQRLFEVGAVSKNPTYYPLPRRGRIIVLNRAEIGERSRGMTRANVVGYGLVMVAIIFLGSILQPTSLVKSQDGGDDACTTIVSDALQLVGTDCAEMGRNEACYGHIALDATFRTDSPPPFTDSGDLIAITQLDSLTTQPINLDTGAWGIALMLVQADLPDEGDATMTFVLMGDTQLQATSEASEELPSCSATNASANNLNIRREPDTNSEIMGTIPPNADITVNGRTETGDWLHTVSDDVTGWVFASLLTLDCEIDTLSALNPADEPLAPMQAFTFQSNPSETCETVPDGLLIRSPDGQRARVEVNGVELVFSSAGYLTTPSNDVLSIQGLDGQIEVTSDGQTETITPDFFTTVPLTNLQADGPPAPPEPVSDAQILLLPAFTAASTTLIDHQIGIQACTINVTETVNQRSGPGTNYPISGQLSANESLAVTGQAEGSDGVVWWQLENGAWVRSDLVTSLGSCGGVAPVTPPPTPTPNPNAPSGSFTIQSGSWRYVETIIETGCPGVLGGQLIYEDMRLSFSADYSTMTETSTSGPYSFYGGTMSITYTRTSGTTYVFNYVGEPTNNTTTLTFTSATTAVGESYFPPDDDGSCGTRWRIVATKN